jgi:hypothetical protein
VKIEKRSRGRDEEMIILLSPSVFSFGSQMNCGIKISL